MHKFPREIANMDKNLPSPLPSLLYFLWGNGPLYRILELEDFLLILFSLNIFFLKELTSQLFPAYIVLLCYLTCKISDTAQWYSQIHIDMTEDTVPRSSAILARLDKVQKSLCTTPSVGVSVGVHIYVKVFLMAYIFQII